MSKTAFSALLVCLLASSASAAEFIFGIGQDDVDGQGTQAAALQLEYHTDAFREYNWGSVAGLLATQVDEDGDTYAGVGLSVLWNTSERWFLEGSLAVGYYDQGNGGTDLGGDVQFRTLVGFGYRLSDHTRVSIAIDHLSNASLESVNPGRNSVSLRYGIEF